MQECWNEKIRCRTVVCRRVCQSPRSERVSRGMQLEHEELTGQIIGAAIAVHRALGPGFVESVYEESLAVELRARAIGFTRQLAVPVCYRGVEVGLHRLDLLVADEIVVELKAVKSVDDAHFAVLRSYLRAVDRKHGLILNFARHTLQVRRVWASTNTNSDSSPPALLPSLEISESLESDRRR
jgi:GxxExxY protein